MMVRYVTCCLLLTLVACSKQQVAPPKNSSAENSHASIVLTADDQQRLGIKNAWVAAARKVAADTHDGEAQMVVDKLLSNLATLGLHGPKQLRVLNGVNADSAFVYFFSYNDPKDFDEAPNDVMRNRKAAAMYNFHSQVILVDEIDKTSEIWKGIILLHEGHHAGDLAYAPYDADDEQIFSEKEKDVHEFQNRLVSSLGGEAYAQLLSREVKRIRAELAKSGLKGYMRQPGAYTNLSIPTRTDYDMEMDKIFTPALSQLEKDFRQTGFWIQANYLIFDQDRGLGDDSEEGKAKFMYALYKQGLFAHK